MLHNPEYRLKARSSQDRSVKHKNYARTTDKGFPQGRIYSLVLCNNLNETQVDRQDYQLVTITNLLIEQTRSNAGAFVDEMKRQMDGGIKNLSNNMAFELFGSGTATRGVTSGAVSNPSPGVYQLQLANPQNVVNFEVGMTLQASATDGGAVLPVLTPNTPDLGTVTSVNRATGVIQFSIAQGTPNVNWASGSYLTVQGDIPPAGGSGSGPLGSVGSYLAASGFSAWLPATDPSPSDSFWGVNRSVDPTRLAGLRYNASAYSIEEGVTNALGLKPVQVKPTLIDMEVRQDDMGQAKAA